MIVPHTRLLFWFAMVVLPFSVLGTLYRQAALFSVVLIAGLFVLALLDAGLVTDYASIYELTIDQVAERAVHAVQQGGFGETSAALGVGQYESTHIE